MNTPAHPRPARVVAAGALIGGAAVVVGAVIAGVTRAITGRASPLPATPPWAWSLRDIAAWFSGDATSTSAADVAARVLAVVAWAALAVIVVNLLRELGHQARHGVIRRPARIVDNTPAPPVAADRVPRAKVRRRHSFAATFVAVLLGGSSLAAGTAGALPARVPAAAVIAEPGPDGEVTPAVVDAPDAAELSAGWRWGTHTVTSPHESLASIARHYGDDPILARTIWEANHGRDMGAGDRFDDPAVVKLGWTLRIPTHTTPESPTASNPVPVAAAATDAPPAHHIVITEPGDTMWDQIDDVVDTPTAADITAVAHGADGATTPAGPWVFDADNPDLIHAGMAFDLQPAIDLHQPPDVAEPAAATDPAPPPPVEAAPPPPPAATPVPAAETPATMTPVAADPATTVAASPAAPTVTVTVPDVVATAPAASGAPGGVWAAPAGPPTTSAVQPGDVAATPPAVGGDPAAHDESGQANPIVPLAAAGMTIAGLVIGLDRRRRRRQAHDRDGRPVLLPDGELATHEQVLRAGARLDRAARANAALRHLSASLAERATVMRSRYILVDDDVTVVLEQPAAAPDGWEAVEEPTGWRCTLDDTALTYAADVNPHPWPAVVPLGVTVDGDATMLIDLEAAGITGFTGRAGPDVCAAVICALGASPFADMLTVIDDGHIALYGLDRYLSNRINLGGLDALLERLDTWSGPFRFDARHLLAQRHDDPGELEPCVAAIVARVDDTERARLRALPTDGTRPIAIITTEASIARTVIDVNEHGVAIVDGRTIRCHRLTAAVADTARQLIEHADSAPPAQVRHPEPATPVEQPSLFPPDPDAWSVRLLGPLHIQHQHLGELVGGRSRQLLTLLSLHPAGLTGEDIYDSLVPDKVADPDSKRTYVKARMSELRKLLGGGDTIAGRTHLPLTSTAGTDRYRLEVVDVDAARFRQLVDHPRNELADLTAALELIDGEIGDGEIAWYPWATRTVHDLHALVVDTGRRLANAAIAAGEPTLADWAATQTRLGVPFDQSVVPLAIQARSLLGDSIGVRRLRDEIVDTHNGDLATDVRAAFDDALAAG